MLLQKELNQLEEYVNSFEKINPSISSKSIGWHIDHSLKVINSVVDVLKESDPKDYKWNSILLEFLYTPLITFHVEKESLQKEYFRQKN